MPCALPIRSEEHTSELQSHDNLVCRLLLEKKIDRAGPPPPGGPRPPTLVSGVARGGAPRARAVAARARPARRARLGVRSIFFLNEAATPETPPLPPPPPLPT